MSGSSIPQKTWEMANNMEIVNSVDNIYRYDKVQQQDILTAKPWDKEYDYYYNLWKLLFAICLFRTFGFVFVGM